MCHVFILYKPGAVNIIIFVIMIHLLLYALPEYPCSNHYAFLVADRMS